MPPSPLMWRRTSTTLASHGHARLSSTATSRVAFAFDLDGVVYRSGAVIPQGSKVRVLDSRGAYYAQGDICDAIHLQAA